MYIVVLNKVKIVHVEFFSYCWSGKRLDVRILSVGPGGDRFLGLVGRGHNWVRVRSGLTVDSHLSLRLKSTSVRCSMLLAVV